jgi:hypothetical protein
MLTALRAIFGPKPARRQPRHGPDRTPRAPRPNGSSSPSRPLPYNPGGSDQGACVARCAESHVGDPYVWATAGPNTFDCSGLVYWCVKQCTGREISRSSYDQANLGERVQGGLAPGDVLVYGGGSHVGIVTGPNRQVTALNENAGVVVAATPGNMGLPYNGARRLVKGTATVPPPTTLPGTTVYTLHDIPGSQRPLPLPQWLPLREQLTPLGPNRSGEPMRPTVTVAHSTNNPRVGANAADHAAWQANGTPGHPDGYVGVHFYVDANEVVLVIPPNEKGVHSGDWRNDWGIAVERTTNADQDQGEAENNAMHVHAGLLWMIQQPESTGLTPHTNGGHCPQLINPWPEFERIVALRMQRIEGQA